MWVIAAIWLCTVQVGCMSGTRDASASDRWQVAPTEQVCIQRNRDLLLERVAKAGDRLVSLKILCERMGV